MEYVYGDPFCHSLIMKKCEALLCFRPPSTPSKTVVLIHKHLIKLFIQLGPKSCLFSYLLGTCFCYVFDVDNNERMEDL